MGESKRNAELLERVNAEMRQWGTRQVILDLDINGTVAFCGALQLALRHSEFSGTNTAQAAREIVMRIADQMKDYPAIQELIKLGFHPRFDQ